MKCVKNVIRRGKTYSDYECNFPISDQITANIEGEHMATISSDKKKYQHVSELYSPDSIVQ